MREIIQDILFFIKSKGFLDEQIVIEENESLTEAGVIDSIGVLQLVDFIEDKYKIKISIEDITQDNFDTLQGIENLITHLVNRK